MVLGLVASVVLASGSLLKAIGMVLLGLLLGVVGTDVNSGSARYTFDMPELADGINFVIVAMGMFGIGEIIRNLEHDEDRNLVMKKVTGLMLNKEDFKRIMWPVLRGTGLGSLLGILPGGGAMLASFASYSIEKKVSKNAANFGKGAIEGVAAPEAANNAGAQTSFIPMLTLGIPSNPVMALMIGAMIIQGIQPGPAVMTEQPGLFWGLIVSMWVGNLFLVVLNLPMIGIWVRMIMVPYQLLYPAILMFCAIGVFSLNNSTFDVYLMALFGLLGYLCAKLELRARADAARLHHRPDDGRIPAPRPAALARRSDGIHRAPDLGRHARPGRRSHDRRPAAFTAQETRRSLPGRLMH